LGQCLLAAERVIAPRPAASSCAAPGARRDRAGQRPEATEKPSTSLLPRTKPGIPLADRGPIRVAAADLGASAAQDGPAGLKRQGPLPANRNPLAGSRAVLAQPSPPGPRWPVASSKAPYRASFRVGLQDGPASQQAGTVCAAAGATHERTMRGTREFSPGWSPGPADSTASLSSTASRPTPSCPRCNRSSRVIPSHSDQDI
jgi:hypothetical protein